MKHISTTKSDHTNIYLFALVYNANKYAGEFIGIQRPLPLSFLNVKVIVRIIQGHMYTITCLGKYIYTSNIKVLYRFSGI